MIENTFLVEVMNIGDVSYLPLIEDMVWSYSRIKTFEDCPYR